MTKKKKGVLGHLVTTDLSNLLVSKQKNRGLGYLVTTNLSNLLPKTYGSLNDAGRLFSGEIYKDRNLELNGQMKFFKPVGHDS